jgi:hypothetical protein
MMARSMVCRARRPGKVVSPRARRSLVAAGTLGVVALGVAHAWAQSPAPAPDPAPVQGKRVMVWRGGGAAGAGAGAFTMPLGMEPQIEFMATSFGLDGEPVTGAPYSAEAVTEAVQTLSDGNRIVRQSKAAVYRDGNGRTRREQGLAVIGALVGAPEDRRQVHISDPQKRVTYILDTEERTAHKLPAPNFEVAGAAPMPAGPGGDVLFERPLPPPVPPPGAGHAQMFFQARGIAVEGPAPVVESLGTQTIEGVQAEGTRTTITIPAGQIGNEQPITIVSERWFSPELKVLVQSRQHDPRFGETTYRLTAIVRGEPAADLFEVPGDYTIVEPGARRDVIYRMKVR